MAERLLEVLREPFRLTQDRTPYVVTGSIGIARGQRETAEDLLRDADVALYRAKAAGRNCYVMFDEHMHQQVSDRLVLEMDLRDAIRADQFFLVYQPTFAIDDGATTGLEALIRWHHPTAGRDRPLGVHPDSGGDGSDRAGRTVGDQGGMPAGSRLEPAGPPGRGVGQRVGPTTRLPDAVR